MPIGFGLALCLTLPLRTAFELGSDEGFELMKAFLVSCGHPLYTEVWNDQPPLHTHFLALLFRLFGPSAYVGRLLSVGFAMLLVGTLYQLVKPQAGRIGGCVAVALLVSSASFLQLSVSVMLELPALSLAMASLWLVVRESGRQCPWQWIGSGVVFACALQIKLTSALFFPALLAGFFVLGRGSQDRRTPLLRAVVSAEGRAVAIWCGAVTATWIIIALLTREWITLTTFWKAHFSSATHTVAAARGYRWNPLGLLENWPLVISSGTGILFAFIADRRRLAIPLVLFATAVTVHVWHRPYWEYYKLHFAIPMAWLGGVCVVSWFRLLWQQEIPNSVKANVNNALQFLLWSVMTASILVSTPANVIEEIKRLRSVSIASDNEVLRALREGVPNTTWVFTDQRTATFWGGWMIPPPLAVIPKKRFWSNQINADQVVDVLHRFAPEQILIPVDWETKFRLESFLEDYYQKGPEPIAGAGNHYLRR